MGRTEALRAFEAGDWKRALPLLEAHCQRHPGDAEAWGAQADTLRQLGRFGEAAAAYRHALQIEKQPDWWEGRIRCLLSCGRPDEANRAREKARARFPDLSERWHRAGTPYDVPTEETGSPPSKNPETGLSPAELALRDEDWARVDELLTHPEPAVLQRTLRDLETHVEQGTAIGRFVPRLLDLADTHPVTRSRVARIFARAAQSGQVESAERGVNLLSRLLRVKNRHVRIAATKALETIARAGGRIDREILQTHGEREPTAQEFWAEYDD